MALFGGGRAAEVLVADVAGKITANDAYWADKCKTIPSNALFIVVKMGAVRDHFRPVKGATFCEMLQSNNTHQWSYNGVEWVTPDFNGNGNANGGSDPDWPRDKGRAGDNRKYLSFWGIKHDSLTGGCCSTSTASYTSVSFLRRDEATQQAWGHP
eukprot:gene12870-biopygen29133